MRQKQFYHNIYNEFSNLNESCDVAFDTNDESNLP